ncbi:patatin-like phospholipase family protein [Massilia sp. PAMC28688]|uniref:patatin-like phospholipase family protein n=1 Tax=Massilia sp. PAMC28688 TaxID=2861283 RepID=UPI001C638003|nr:patatin-like phospholipase family protein [Massilia sp. PAMC28688]QYF93823.1 patatin-like phospholipase family protein [Massilia sp. PAMC28688]
MKTSNHLNPKQLPIVLVLQGGGALGAYQAGVYQALHEHDLVPDWIVGTSIGAINAALIAGNRQEHRLQRIKQFWDRVSHPDHVDMSRVSDAMRQSNIWFNTIDTVVRGAPGFFAPRLFSGFPFGMDVAPEQASFYDTCPLNTTLEELVDFDYLNQDKDIRLTVNAVNVRTGELAHFDSRTGTLCADHVRASGSLPPGFAGVRIDGELYWDGGLYSNTPLESVLNELPSGDTLCFMVDLWSADGLEPVSMEEVRTRLKDVTFASRSQRHIDDYTVTHTMQRKLRELYARLPPDSRTEQDEQELLALGCDATLHIVRLPYSGRDWHMAAKDINFSRGSIAWRWDQGYGDAMRALKSALWLQHVAEDTAVVVHELPPVQ